MASSKANPNLVKSSTSLNWASSSLRLPANFFIVLFCAAEPTRLTDNPGLTAGRIPLAKSSVSKKICPSVMEITFVGMYADTSP